MAILAIEVLNFLLGLAIFVTGYIVSVKAFSDKKDSSIKREDLKSLMDSVKWIAVSFLFLALHEFTVILTDLNIIPFDLTIAYLITEALFVGAIIFAAYQFREILYLVIRPEETAKY